MMTLRRTALRLASIATTFSVLCAPANAAHRGAAAAASRSLVRVELISFRGWSDVYRITNGTADLIVAPGIGRILDYRLTGQPATNPLWINPALAGQSAAVMPGDWANFGGEKIWPSPQSDWPGHQHQSGEWPPDRQFECGPYSVSRLPNGIRLTGPWVKNYGLRVVRDITMDPRGASVHLSQRFIKSAGAADTYRIGVWSIAQTRPDAFVTIPLSPNSRFPKGYIALTPGAHGDPNWRVAGRTLQIHHVNHVDNKLGVDNPANRLSARYPSSPSRDTVFTIQFGSRTQGAYPDHGSSIEVYNRGDPAVAYLELEALSPLSAPGPGQSVDQEATWRLQTTARRRAHSR
ncbi:hypothetical protein CCAX7_000150 [Capsulimonas corticalis]|uniref:Uncharacterized protein n=1 Tax=Capsulimonas corticalis TaxID=2219043 RepID=A0A402CR28_9BACT|nr:DUF4380 domain-containing protein [Capsulimonas corticalis]BDI27964.1 hypothetical protein CCAX7_000150 [Capsulimonas corticalis]